MIENFMSLRDEAHKELFDKVLSEIQELHNFILHKTLTKLPTDDVFTWYDWHYITLISGGIMPIRYRQQEVHCIPTEFDTFGEKLLFLL
jgi:hypothetical protein